MVGIRGSDTLSLRESDMARYEVIATATDGTATEGPFYYVAPDPEGAIQQYLEWAHTLYVPQPFLGPVGAQDGRGEFPMPNLKVTLVG